MSRCISLQIVWPAMCEGFHHWVSNINVVEGLCGLASRSEISYCLEIDIFGAAWASSSRRLSRPSLRIQHVMIRTFAADSVCEAFAFCVGVARDSCFLVLLISMERCICVFYWIRLILCCISIIRVICKAREIGVGNVYCS